MANVMQITTMLSNFQHHQRLLLANGNICETKLTELGFGLFLESKLVPLALEKNPQQSKKTPRNPRN